jgi:hypothetical protein
MECNDLKKIFMKANALYSELVKTADSVTSRREISSGPYYNVVPFEHQMDWKFLYLFDNEDRIVAIREGTPIEDVFNETFYNYCGDRIISYYFVDREITRITQYILNEKKIVNSCSYAELGEDKKEYKYTGDALTSMKVHDKEHSDNEFEQYDVVFEYDSSGALTKITQIFTEDYSRQAFP